MKKILTTPITDEQIRDLHIGDTVYLTGMLATCRDSGHKRVVYENTMPQQFQTAGGVIYHAGPIIGKDENGEAHIVSVGPTTSRRMEAVQAAFIEKTGVKMLIGKGGMMEKTAAACKRFCAIHCAFPGGCGVVAAQAVEEIAAVEWEDLGMPEALWILKVKEFGPLIVSIDTDGNNLFENNTALYRERLEELVQKKP